jgi:hypothetical protein
MQMVESCGHCQQLLFLMDFFSPFLELGPFGILSQCLHFVLNPKEGKEQEKDAKVMKI